MSAATVLRLQSLSVWSDRCSVLLHGATRRLWHFRDGRNDSDWAADACAQLGSRGLDEFGASALALALMDASSLPQMPGEPRVVAAPGSAHIMSMEIYRDQVTVSLTGGATWRTSRRHRTTGAWAGNVVHLMRAGVPRDLEEVDIRRVHDAIMSSDLLPEAPK